MKFVAYEKGTQRILFHDLDVAAPAVVWRNSHKKENATPQQRAQVVVWYAETESFITVQQNYRLVYGGDAPDTKTIKAWFDKILATGCVLKQSGGTCQSVSEEKLREIHIAFQGSTSKSIRQASRELHVPCTTMHRVLHKQLHSFAYKVQITQELKPDDKPKQLGLHC
jgi:hypothetical protein